MTSKIYVFAPTTQGHLLAGRASWQDKVGTFEYAPDWLDHPQAYALDPRNLPLVERVFSTPSNEGVFGVLADAGPDAWGRQVIEHSHKQRPTNPLEYLVSGNGDGAGALRFSLSRSAMGKMPNHLAFKNIEAVAQAERAMDEGRLLSEAEIRLVWEAGSSMGGARPKLTVGEGRDSWLVKLARKDDPMNMAILEHACLQVARRAGLRVPDSHISTIGQRSALFVRRFDRGDADQRVHYLSAHALLNLHRLKPTDVLAPHGLCTYGSLAALAQHSMGIPVGPEMFQRMIFNVVLGNTDDHGRNLGFLKPVGQPWQMAPAFDLTVVGDAQHAMGLGLQGRDATLANACSDLRRFQVTPAQAEAIVKQVIEAVAELPALMRHLGAPPADLAWVERRLPSVNVTPDLFAPTPGRRRAPR